MFTLVVTAPVCRVTDKFFHIWKIHAGLWMGFVFKRCFASYHELISNSMIVVDSSKVFADYVFFYLHLFTLTYVFSIVYMIY